MQCEVRYVLDVCRLGSMDTSCGSRMDDLDVQVLRLRRLHVDLHCWRQYSSESFALLPQKSMVLSLTCGCLCSMCPGQVCDCRSLRVVKRSGRRSKGVATTWKQVSTVLKQPHRRQRKCCSTEIGLDYPKERVAPFRTKAFAERGFGRNRVSGALKKLQWTDRFVA